MPPLAGMTVLQCEAEVLGALIIVFREIIEAGLIVGIVLAAARGVRGSRATILMGVVAGALGAALVAAFAGAIAGALEGVGQEAFNAAILIVAVVMLTWHNVWMASHGREIALEMRAVGHAVAEGSKPLGALAVVVGVAVLREGSEVALFLYGVGTSEGGSALGLVAGVAVAVLTYLGLVTIPQRRLFAVTTLLISFLAAGLAAQAVAFLQQAGILDFLTQTAWDTSWILTDSSLVGRVLHTLIGYSDAPSVLQALVYAGTLAIIFVLTKAFGPRRAPVRRAVGAAPAE